MNKNDNEVVLKILNNSQNITLEFLNEVANNNLADFRVVPLYGVSQDPKTKNYVMVMEYMKGGNLRQHLQKKSKELSLEDKISGLIDIFQGLSVIHNKGLVHKDFHPGNIFLLNDFHSSVCVADFGLSRPANEEVKETKIYGVLPYVAPEVLMGEPYTQAADAYSLGMVAYE